MLRWKFAFSLAPTGQVPPFITLSPPAAAVTSDVLPTSCLSLVGIHFLYLGGHRLCVTGCVGHMTGKVAKSDAGV